MATYRLSADCGWCGKTNFFSVSPKRSKCGEAPYAEKVLKCKCGRSIEVAVQVPDIRMSIDGNDWEIPDSVRRISNT